MGAFYWGDKPATSSGIKTVQRGTAQFIDAIRELDVSITSVDPDKSFVLLTQHGGNDGGTIGSHVTWAAATLLDATTLRLTRASSYGNPISGLAWQVVEFA